VAQKSHKNIARFRFLNILKQDEKVVSIRRANQQKKLAKWFSVQICLFSLFGHFHDQIQLLG
jgi:hypothetical protein